MDVWEQQQSGLSIFQANAIYDILVTRAGAREANRPEFVYHQTDRLCPEFRFQGTLGFGGKFRRDTGRRADGSYGEVWRVDCYPEDRTPERDDIVIDVNERLEALREAG